MTDAESCRNSRARRKAKGICYRCGTPCAPYVRCRAHRLKEAAGQAARRWRQAKNRVVDTGIKT